MSLALTIGCLMCHINRSVEKAQAMGDDDQALQFARELVKLIASAPDEAGIPWFGPPTNELYQRIYGVEEDRFRQEKQDSNRFVLERMDQIRARVCAAADPVKAGLQFAILGNYIDFSALRGQVSFAYLDSLMESALEMELDGAACESLFADLAAGKRLLYLTDNAGEIGFDRIFAEQIAKAYPHLQITFCVRGGPTANDATREDAEAMGIPFPVIDNGNNIAGTELTRLSKEAEEAFQSADVIISKGLGNVETLYGCGYNVYYAFLVKCARFQELFQKPLMTPMLVKERK